MQVNMLTESLLFYTYPSKCRQLLPFYMAHTYFVKPKVVWIKAAVWVAFQCRCWCYRAIALFLGDFMQFVAPAKIYGDGFLALWA